MSGGRESTGPPEATDAVNAFVHRWQPGSRRDLTLLLLHGTGGDENDLLPLGPALAPGAGLLSPRGQVVEHGLPRFFRRFAEGVFDVPDLLQRTDDLAEFVTAAARLYDFEPSGLMAVGYSNGANIAASLMLRHPSALAGGVLLRPMVPFESESLPDLKGRQVMIGAGRGDRIATPAHAEALSQMLANAGASVTLAWSDADHGLGPHDFAEARNWLAKAVPAK